MWKERKERKKEGRSPNYRELDLAFYRGASIPPQTHTVVVWSDVPEKNTWAAQSLCCAFSQAEEWNMDRLNKLQFMLPWLHEQLDGL